MKHKDGIEVYLKPRREGGDELRFPEHPEFDKDPLRNRCCVPVIEGPCKIVIKFANDFNMFSANCVTLGCAYRSPSSGWLSRRWELRESLVAGQQHEILDLKKENEPLPLRVEAYRGTMSCLAIHNVILRCFSRLHHPVTRPTAQGLWRTRFIARYSFRMGKARQLSVGVSYKRLCGPHSLLSRS